MNDDLMDAVKYGIFYLKGKNMKNRHYFYVPSGEVVIFDGWPDPEIIPINSYFHSPDDPVGFQWGFINSHRSITGYTSLKGIPAAFKAMLLILK